MLIGGLQKTTLIDYPGKVACTVFTVGCNFACPFCHNKDLVSLELFEKSGIQPIKEEEFFEFLKKRKKILEGVCITGGEPTIWPDLPEFIKKIKSLGYFIKLDTNGSYPKMLEKLIKEKLVNYIAMDLKGPFDNYEKFIRRKLSIFSILRSIEKIVHLGIDYEFRTTVVPGLHTKESLVRLAKQLKSLNAKYKILNTDFNSPAARRSANWRTPPPQRSWGSAATNEESPRALGAGGGFNWVLQQFRPQNCLEPKYLKVKPYTEKEMKAILQAVQKILPKTKLRGIET